MDKNREARRGVTMAASNGLSRRRHRSNSLRDSPVEDGVLDLRETARLRDRKKDRERDRDRDRERERERDRGRERDRERERDMLSRISKRRRSDKFMHGSMREDGVDDTSEESVNDDEDDDDDDGGGGNFSSMLILPPNPSTSSSPLLNHHSNNHHHYHHNSNNQNSNSNNNHSNHIRRSFPPPAKFFRGTPPSVTSTTTTTTTTITWKAANEMIGVSVPRKARSVSTKRSHDWAPSGGPGTGSVGEEKIHRQASTSPVRPSVPIVMATPAPAFPSSNSLSVKKKMKPNGPKLRPPKSSSNKTSSSAQDEIEIEIAEVLYGMMRQPQGPSKQELVGSDSVSVEICSNNNNIKSRNEAKSRVSSPISNSPSTLPLSSSNLPTNSSSSTAPMADIAPKSKRPRPVKCNGENPSMFKVCNSPILATTKNEMDQSAKTEPSQNLEKHSATAAAENGSISHYLVSSQASELQLESMKPDSNGLLDDSKGLTEESESGRGDLSAPKEEPQSPKKESAAGLILDDDRRDNMDVTKANSMPSEVEIQREEKFQIDLMAPPLRSSLERDAEIDSVAVDLQPGQKPAVKEDEKEVKTVKDNGSVEAEEKKSKTVAEESESQKPVVGKERNIDLQRDLKKSDRDNGSVSLTGNKVHQHVQKKPQQPPVTEKTAQSDSLPLPISMASWPGGLPPMGYMAPLQGVVSMDGSAVSSSSIQPPHLLSSQPRPKRCATHCNVARNIHYHQQFMKMYPLWPAAAGSASLYGVKAGCNLNVVSPTELHGTFPGKGVNTVTDKGQNLAIFPSHAGKDSKSTQPATIMDAAQRKQALLRQALPPGVRSNILHAPAFIFPLSQQQAPAAAVRPGSVKSLPAVSKDASSSASNSAIVNASASVGTAATTMSFNYPNMSGNETQYLAILQNNGYPFPISAHVGLAPAYRGTHAQAMPFFNGSFYSSQMLHPSQFQQQQQPLPTQSQQTQQGHQNTSISSGSSSSQKHLQNQQQRVNSSGINSSRVPLQGFPTSKNQAQVQRQQQNQQVPRQAGQHESEMGGEESPSTADDRVSHANMNVYGQNFAMPLRPPNFALMTPTPTSTSEKKPQQQQSSKAGVESLMPRTFAMTFASINGAATAPGFDISSIAQNPALLQSVPEAVTHGYQIMAAAQAAQLNKNSRVSEEVKTGGNDPSNAEEVRKSTSGKSPTTVGQSIAFSRRDFTDAQVSVMTGNTILDSSTQTLNLGSVPARCNVSFMPASVCNSNGSAAQQQLQRSQQQHEQMMQIQKQQQFAAVASAAQRSKNQATSCGSVHSDHLHASSVAAKFPNAFSVFPQNLVQSSSSQAQSPQWKNSGRTNTSQINSQSLSSSTTASLKNLPHQQGRNQQGQTQISFAANPKSSSAQGQTPPSNNQSASPPMIVGSPRSSSISKTSAIGSPRTTATTSRSIKCSQTSLSSQQAKNSPSMPSRKSSPVPSILGNPNISSSTGAKQQMSEQQQQQLSKHAFQQAQLFFSNAAYMQAQAQAQAQNAASATSSASAPSSFFIQRHREQQQPGSLATSSSGMLSLCPTVTHSNSGTSDPEKAVTAACNIKGLSSHGLVQTGQFAATQSSGKQHHLVPPGFQNVHAVPTPVQVKPSEQKQPAGE